MLLEVDVLSKQQKNGVPSCYEVEMDAIENLPFSSKILVGRGDKTNLDLSAMGHGNDVKGTHTEAVIDNDCTDSETDIKCVKDMSFDRFREKLVRHFNIAFQFKEITCPSRLKN